MDDIAREVDRLGAPLVLLTGGEPMLQRELPALAARLLAAGYKVMIETSGAHPLATLPDEVVRIVDVKTPASGESHRMRWELLADAAPARTPPSSWWRMRGTIGGRARSSASTTSAAARRCCSHPSMGGWTPKIWSHGCCAIRLPARLNLQLHKYVWDPEARGV